MKTRFVVIGIVMTFVLIVIAGFGIYFHSPARKTLAIMALLTIGVSILLAATDETRRDALVFAGMMTGVFVAMLIVANYFDIEILGDHPLSLLCMALSSFLAMFATYEIRERKKLERQKRIEFRTRYPQENIY